MRDPGPVRTTRPSVVDDRLSRAFASGVPAAVLCAMTWQLSGNVERAASGRGSGLFDLIGWLAIMPLGLALYARTVRLWRVAMAPTVLFATFVVLLSINLYFTAPQKMVSILLSFDGVVAWLVLGMLASLTVSTIERRLAQDQCGRTERRLLLLAPHAMMLALALAVLDYARDPVATLTYQAAAANFAVLAATAVMLTARSHRAVSQPVPASSIAFLAVVGTFAASQIAFMNSLAVIPIWLSLVMLLCLATGQTYGLSSRSRTLLLLVLAMLWYKGTGMFATLVRSTRLAELWGGVEGFSALDSRSALADTFGRQFGIDPIAGHMSAESLAGLADGQYVHSVALSLLTHTGIVGSIVFWVAVVAMVRSVARRADATISSSFDLKVFASFLAIGCVIAFFTWGPLWFMIGWMIAPSFRVRRADAPVPVPDGLRTPAALLAAG